MTGGEKRRYIRYPVSYEATIERQQRSIDPSANETFPARITDISQGGAKLELRDMVHPKEKLRIIVRDTHVDFGLDVSSTVRWSQKVTGGYHAGVEFTKVRKFSLKPKKPATEKPARPTSASRTPSSKTPPASKGQA